MSKYEDDVMELIETVVENSHPNAAKPFGRGGMPKAIDAKYSRDGDAPRKNRQNGGSPELTTGPTQHPQRFRRTRPHLTPRSVTMRNLLKIRPCRIGLPHDGNPRARHV